MAFRDDDATGQFRYLEGYVELRRAKDQYQKVFCILYANTLSFYEQKRTLRELERTKPLEVATLTFKKTSFKVDDLKLTVKNASKLMSTSDLKLRFTTTEERDNWYIRLHTICYAKPPSDIPLLPGQRQISNDIQQLEAKRSSRRLSSPSINLDLPPPTPPPEPPQPRRQSSTHYPHALPDRDQFNLFPPGHPPTEPFPPMWFFGKIPRHHAEQILKDNPRYGDILIRASESTQGPGEFSLSVRQISRDGHAVIRHYKLNRIRTSGLNRYKLDIDEEHQTMSSVYELLLFFIEKSGGSLKLFETQDSKVLKMPDNLYENRFSEIFTSDPDNGEVHRSSSRRPNLNSKGSFVKNQTPPWAAQPEDDYLSPDISPGINHSYANTTNPAALAADDASSMRPNMPPLPRINEEGNSNPAKMSRSMRK